jgi:type I restriction enzyme S subunit
LLIENILDRRTSMRIVKLRDISELKTGPFGTQFRASEYVTEGIPVINVKNIGYGSLLVSGLDHVSENTLERLSEHKLQEGDIVFGRKGSVDRHCLIRKGQDGWMQGSDCIRVRFTDAIVYPEFVSYYLLTDAVKMKINNSAVGSTMASLNTDILGDIDIILPDCEEQKRIALILGTIDKKISNNNQINDYLSYQSSMVA